MLSKGRGGEGFAERVAYGSTAKVCGRSDEVDTFADRIAFDRGTVLLMKLDPGDCLYRFTNSLVSIAAAEEEEEKL